MTIGDKIKSLRISQNLTQEELAQAVKTKKQTIHKYETGIISNIPASKIKLMADCFNTTPAYLMGWEEQETDISTIPGIITNFKTKRVPLLGSVACGEPIFAQEEYGEYIRTDEAVDCDFALRAQGDSMIGARIHDGDLVYVKQQEMVNNGDIAVVLIGDEVTLKRVQYHRNKNRLVLYPENPAYEPLIYVDEELDEIRILGKAVAFQSML